MYGPIYRETPTYPVDNQGIVYLAFNKAIEYNIPTLPPLTLGLAHALIDILISIPSGCK